MPSTNTLPPVRSRSSRPDHAWGAVFAGLVLALAVSLLLHLLGLAIGLASLEPLAENAPFAGLLSAAGLWSLLTAMLALAIGGFVAGRLAPRHGLLHGLLVWAVSALAAVYLLTSLAGSLGAAGASLQAMGADLSALMPQAAQPVPEAGAGAPDATAQLRRPDEQSARVLGEAAAERASQVSWALLIVLLVKAVIAALAGALGQRSRRREA